MISLEEVTAEKLQRFQDNILEIERASFPTPWSLNAFKEELNRTISHLWVLIVDGELVGYICFWVLGGQIHLMNVAVHPERRRKGFGCCLLAKMVEAGISEGAEEACLEVRPSNVIARAFYKKAGFKEIACRPRYYRETNEDAIVMSISLLPRGARSLQTNYESGMEGAS